MTKQELIKVFQEKQKIDDILLRENDWDVLYHLSPIRKNILAWMDFEKGSTMLEIGCGSGSLTELFCEKQLNVTAIDLSEEDLEICRARTAEYENILKINNSLKMLDPEQIFDYVSLIGTLEDAALYCGEDDSVEKLLMYVRGRLKATGKLILAFHNKYAVRYAAGMPEIRTGKLFDGIQAGKDKKAFSRQEITESLVKVGFSKFKIYYPYPDYELSLQIFSDEYLPKEDDITESAASYRWPRMQLFDEVLAYDAICKDGLYPQFANSYLMICE